MTILHLSNILDQVHQCKICQDLPLGPRPIIQAHQQAKLLIIGQAPGIKVHQSGIPWNDASGERLRRWLDLDSDTFYDPSQIAIIPMGLCYPGKGKSGDLPPRKVCAPHWHPQLLPLLPNIEMTLLIGQYAQNFYLADKPATLTATVAAWQQWAPRFIPLPHPSPRNSIWLKKNPWFEADVVPYIRHYVHQHLGKTSNQEIADNEE
ncbi:IclR family transcriptional regulator [Photobacterium kishitanii]|uniref:uracil-DNA glycosylase family protein n=1 Tax=Photobacterium kishitanii TaxID=318456 RepID=UPI0005D32733|nr:uracil-DNA glycosylase family protein [Photobacterium kishitanii]PSU18363.1 IclR family transcriptional regulator [Photobacterium kishitanii]PSV03834.1 IclR family transcriptional regulator [Photobacterium kishitanii]PSV12260.1 IclR family transcriptional regulator [Photobacterium kishitanii]PSV73908.1 IclR family transcriptional regulator [Photobacterium kishitanii]PSW59260.1 IclR family transcriptional regulator [Photobacterium kishitanii]